MKRLIAIVFVLTFVFSLCAPCFAASTVQRLPENANELFSFSDETSEKLLKKLRSKSKTLGCGLGVYATGMEDIDSVYYTVTTVDDDGKETDNSGPHEKPYGEWVTDEVMNFPIKGNAAVLFVMYDYNTFRLYTTGKGDELFTPEIKTYAESKLNRLFLEHYDYEEVITTYIDLCVELNTNLEAGTKFEIPEAEHPARFCDFADLLYGYDDERAALIEKLNTISEKYEFDVVVLTIKELGYKESWDYAHDYFVNNGYGLGEQHDGIMLLIAIGSGQAGERDWATYTSKGFSDALFEDHVLTKIEDKVLEYLRPSDWIGGFNAFADRCEEVLANNEAKAADDKTRIEKDEEWEYYEEIFKTQDFIIRIPLFPRTDGIWLVIAIGVGLIASLIIVLVMKAKLKSVRFKGDARDYITQGSFKLNETSDVFLYSTVTKTVRESSSSSGGGGGGGHSSGGGHSGKF